jgi:hypothetical protein
MFGKYIDGINWTMDSFSFDDYCIRLLGTGALGGPNLEETRKDYQAMKRCNSTLIYW